MKFRGQGTERVAAILIVVVAAALRFSYPGAIEYKADEQFMFEHALQMGRTEPWSWLGLSSGVALRNPGMSAWIFWLLGTIGQVSTPIGLAQTVQALNTLAIALMVFAAFRWVPLRQRHLWLWAAAFIAVSPVAVLFHRKIWAQCVLPIFSLMGMLGWLHRRKCLGAAFWGAATGILGQIHMSGFFWSASFFLWTLFRRSARRGVRWGWFFGATVVALLPAIPWFVYLSNAIGSGGDWAPSLRGFRSFRYWKHWAADSVGVELDYFLGKDLDSFLRGPHWNGTDTHLMQVATTAAFGIGLIVLLLALAGRRFGWRPLSNRPRGRRRGGAGGPQSGGQAGAAGSQAGRRAVAAGQKSNQGGLDFARKSPAVPPLLWVFGILLTLAHIPIHRHYLIVTFPAEWLWFVALSVSVGRWRVPALSALVALQLIVSVGLLHHLHTHGGAPRGEFGVSYEAQVEGNNLSPQ